MNPNTVELFLTSSGLSQMLDADREGITAFALGHRSFDNAKFNELVDESPGWASVIAAHIYLDNVLDTFLNEFCIKPEAISSDKRRMAAIDKATFLFGVGVLSKGGLSIVKYLNKMRNRFAHHLSFSISDKQREEYRSTMLSCYANRLSMDEEFQNMEVDKIDLKLLLKLSVLFVEEERIVHLIMGLSAARSKADLADAVRIAHLTLSNKNASD